ncbi:unnamed protein product [Durusdinium trenchii]|uniref:Acyltransferase 3 domain-containing protein n=1 Tax=Durusdinium trenchii TaxID=1381693 RepID=A0ABP0KKM0_9DINO
MGAVNYDLCCRNHYGSPHCWGDSAFTFERCCTLRLGKGSHEFFSEARKFLLASWPQQLLMLGSLLLGLKSSAPSKKVPRLIPAVPQLRLLATLWIAAFHVWNLLEPLYPGSDDVKLLESLAVVHTDVFFIVSSYLIAKRPKGAPQEAAVRVALNVLRRAVRLCVPAIVSTCMMSIVRPTLRWTSTAAIWPLCHEFLCYSLLEGATGAQSQEAKLSDILSQYLLTFMLVHVYMLPSRTDRMVPGAAVLLEQLWFLLGVCALPTFLVHLAQQPFQKFFLSAVDVVSRHSVWSSLLPLVAILAVGTAMLLACTEWECIS